MAPETTVRKTAVIVGASSGIGEALARRLHAGGWSIHLLARRENLLRSIAVSLGDRATAHVIDLSEIEPARAAFAALLEAIGDVHVVVVSAGTGDENPGLSWPIEKRTFDVNVVGFAAMADAAINHFREAGGGHLIGITSLAALRASGPAASYAATKAFQSTYLDGLRALGKASDAAITVTEIQPGFIDTAMMKAPNPFWAISADEAAQQIQRAIRRRPKHAYVPRRWALVAWILRLLPRPG